MKLCPDCHRPLERFKPNRWRCLNPACDVEWVWINEPAEKEGTDR